MTVPLLRPSERGDFLGCQWKWWMSWEMGYASHHVPTWAWFGTAIHKALEARYPLGVKRGSLADTLDAFEEAVGSEERRIWTQGGELDEEEIVNGVELGKAMLTGYIKHWGQDRHWEIIHSEQTFQIDIPNRRTGETIAVLCLTVDMVVWDRVDKCFRVVDHKTRATFPQSWRFYDINIQAGSYLWVIPELLQYKGIFGPKDRLDGIVFNCLKKKMPDLRETDAKGRALNKNGTISARQPPPLFYRHTSHRTPQERVRQARHARAEAYHMHLIRTGKLPLLKHPTEDCPRCPFFEVCELDESDPKAARHMARTLYITRDPYASHREEMERSGLELPASTVGERNGRSTTAARTGQSTATRRTRTPRA